MKGMEKGNRSGYYFVAKKKGNLTRIANKAQKAGKFAVSNKGGQLEGKHRIESNGRHWSQGVTDGLLGGGRGRDAHSRDVEVFRARGWMVPSWGKPAAPKSRARVIIHRRSKNAERKLSDPSGSKGPKTAFP